MPFGPWREIVRASSNRSALEGCLGKKQVPPLLGLHRLSGERNLALSFFFVRWFELDSFRKARMGSFTKGSIELRYAQVSSSALDVVGEVANCGPYY